MASYFVLYNGVRHHVPLSSLQTFVSKLLKPHVHAVVTCCLQPEVSIHIWHTTSNSSTHLLGISNPKCDMVKGHKPTRTFWLRYRRTQTQMKKVAGVAS